MGRTICSTLRHRSLPPTTTNTDSIDDIALLGLVSESACLVGSRGAGCTMDDIELSELY
jgi:hypothetical protein